MRAHTAKAIRHGENEFCLAITALPAFTGAARAVTAVPTSNLEPFYHSGSTAQVPDTFF
jgi:hypothetical protein